MIMSGLISLINLTISSRMIFFGHIFNVSLEFLENPKSIAEVKYWLPPSIALACKSSFVLITPNKSFNSVPIKFCPPSPLVNER